MLRSAIKMASQVEEFLLPILEEEVPDDMLFQQDGASQQGSDRLLELQISGGLTTLFT